MRPMLSVVLGQVPLKRFVLYPVIKGGIGNSSQHAGFSTLDSGFHNVKGSEAHLNLKDSRYGCHLFDMTCDWRLPSQARFSKAWKHSQESSFLPDHLNYNMLKVEVPVPHSKIYKKSYDVACLSLSQTWTHIRSLLCTKIAGISECYVQLTSFVYVAR